jgi:methionine sulfoxide reductase catalytic subunit
MLIKKAGDIAASEITPKETYMNRRIFLTGVGVLGAAALAGKGLSVLMREERVLAADRKLAGAKSTFSTDEKQTPFQDATTYNNFYEFGTEKDDPARNAGSLRPRPWTVKIEGHVAKEKTLDIDQIMKLAPLEERVYRLRCVEGWSMVIPWIGFPLSALIKAAEPTSKAQYVEFNTLLDVKQMPGQRRDVLDWPYVEGLRMDEAMHPLAIMAVGMYGEVLPNQNGAPLRLVVPWKYGFKSIKSIVKMKFVTNEPVSSWTKSQPSEYGFYSNVNPQVDHPRWSQATERRLGEFRRRPTLMFNGYADQVASLYKGMDLRKYY